MEIKNAEITRTMLGVEDHGIFTCMIHLDYGGSGQGFGGHNLKCQAYGISYLEKIIEVAGVDSWKNLPGTVVRVRADHCKVHAIGNCLAEKWFDPERDLAGK